MKTKKEEIYEFVRLHNLANNNVGVATEVIAKAMGLQRTNVSTALGKLVEVRKENRSTGTVFSDGKDFEGGCIF